MENRNPIECCDVRSAFPATRFEEQIRKKLTYKARAITAFRRHNLYLYIGYCRFLYCEVCEFCGYVCLHKKTIIIIIIDSHFTRLRICVQRNNYYCFSRAFPNRPRLFCSADVIILFCTRFLRRRPSKITIRIRGGKKKV